MGDGYTYDPESGRPKLSQEYREKTLPAHVRELLAAKATKLSDVPFGDIRIGMRVRSLASGNFGRVSSIIDKDSYFARFSGNEDHFVEVEWENGSPRSIHYHFDYAEVVVV